MYYNDYENQLIGQIQLINTITTIVALAWLVVAILITIFTAKSERSGGNKALIIVFTWLIPIVGIILFFCLRPKK